MRKQLLSFLFALAVTVGVSVSAFGQFNGCPAGFCNQASAGGGGGGAATFTPGSSVAIKANGFTPGTVTFTGLNGGTNYPNGAVVLVGVIQDQNAATLTSPQIGGNASSIVTGSQDSSTKCTLYQATMSGSSADTFSFTNGAAINNVGAAAGYFTNLVSSTRDAAGNETFGNQADNQWLSAHPTGITVNSSGFGVAIVAKISGGAQPTAVTWTNTTSGSGDTFANLATQMTLSLAHTATAGGWDPQAAGVTNNMNFAACMSAATYH